MDEELAALGAERPRQLVGLVEVASVQDHLGAVPARRGDFDERRVLGHDDRGGNGEPLGVERDGKTVVAGAGGDDARAPRVGAQLEQEVGGAALLERARHLEVLQLEVAACPRQLGERVGVRARCLVDGAAQPVARPLDGREVEGAHQGRCGASRECDIHATGMKGVEWAWPVRPRQSMRMSPPSPRPSSTRRSMATRAAYVGSSASFR